MTDLQLALMIGVPVLWNCVMVIAFLIHDRAYWRRTGDHRLDDLRHMWRAELQRVESALKIRIEHLENRR